MWLSELLLSNQGIKCGTNDTNPQYSFSSLYFRGLSISAEEQRCGHTAIMAGHGRGLSHRQLLCQTPSTSLLLFPPLHTTAHNYLKHKKVIPSSMTICIAFVCSVHRGFHREEYGIQDCSRLFQLQLTRGGEKMKPESLFLGLFTEIPTSQWPCAGHLHTDWLLDQAHGAEQLLLHIPFTGRPQR